MNSWSCKLIKIKLQKQNHAKVLLQTKIFPRNKSIVRRPCGRASASHLGGTVLNPHCHSVPTGLLMGTRFPPPGAPLFRSEMLGKRVSYQTEMKLQCPFSSHALCEAEQQAGRWLYPFEKTGWQADSSESWSYHIPKLRPVLYSEAMAAAYFCSAAKVRRGIGTKVYTNIAKQSANCKTKCTYSRLLYELHL